MIAANAGREFVLTATLLFTVVTAVRWLVDPTSPLAIQNRHWLFAVAGVLAAMLIATLMSSPFGRRSGGHMHPGISVFLWLTGEFPGRAVIPYVIAQLAGSTAGAALARFAWGPAVDLVGYAAVQPTPGLAPAALFLAESLPLLAIITVVLVWRRFVPAVIGIGIGLNTAMLAGVSGASVNPARQFGPAVLSGQTDDLWIYLAAPVFAPLALGLVVRAWRRASPGV